MRVLVLSGGGSHGAWQAGAVKALAAKYHYDAVVGSSVGAVNAVGLATVGAEGLESLWANLSGTHKVMTFNWVWPWKWDGIFSFAPLKLMLSHVLSEHPPKMPAYIATLDLATGKLCHDLATDNVSATVDLLAGSCAISGIQSPTNGRIDGGHRDQSPVRFALEALQATEVHVVSADPISPVGDGWKPWRLFPILSIMLRALECMINEMSHDDLMGYDSKVRVIAPAKAHSFSSLDYSPANIRKAFAQGYEEASHVSY